MESSKIAWTDSTFNPWMGCTKVAAGCKFCYAETLMDHRYHKVQWGPTGTRSKTSEKYWSDPMKWNRTAAKQGGRRRVFCASLADVFEEWSLTVVDHDRQVLMRDDGKTPLTLDDLRADLFNIIDHTPLLDWLMVTKRPQNIRKMWAGGGRRENVWLITSLAEQGDCQKFIPPLIACRELAPVLGLSVEPLIGPVDLSFWLDSIDWVIVGGESDTSGGQTARPCNLEWIRDIVQLCADRGVPCFVKQLGSRPFVHKQVHDITRTVKGGTISVSSVEYESTFPITDDKGANKFDWPADLRVQQFPKVERAT